MLNSLHIENIAVIDRADVNFESGFNVLTGETGAGKSILIDSINAVLGERTSKELIRSGCEKASVTAVFTDISKAAKFKLNALGFNADESEILLQRTITESKSTVKINGITSTAAVVREISPYLINIHGQHDSQALLDPEKHYVYIDLLAKNQKLLHEYAAVFAKMQQTRRRIKALSENAEENAKRAELLRFQIDELEQANVTVGEIEQLKARQNEINNARTILESLNNALAIIYNDDVESPCILSLTDEASDRLCEVAKLSNNAEAIAAEISDIRYKIDEAKEKIEQLIDDFDFDEEEIEQVESRLEMYYNFSKKYGATESDMLSFLDNARNELKSVNLSEDELISLQTELKPLVDEVKKLGGMLTESRKNAGEKFARDVARQLAFLDMPKVKIVVDITQSPYSRLGADKIELLISTNPGEPPKPLAKIASGGEMSRIMLSIKNVLSEVDPVDTMIFDEIDTGISGHAAAKVGEKLKQTAKYRQIICVTHLAQIAANADNHLLIEKKIANDRAFTKITQLDYDGKKHELARIIGAGISDATLMAAAEMLDKCK